jgi:hypothetical protein
LTRGWLDPFQNVDLEKFPQSKPGRNKQILDGPVSDIMGSVPCPLACVSDNSGVTNREHDGVSQEAKEVNHLSGSSVGLPRLYGTSPSARKALAIIVIVALAVLALLGATYTQTVSTVHVVAYVARDYGNVNVSVYLDGAFRGTKNVA